MRGMQQTIGPANIFAAIALPNQTMDRWKRIAQSHQSDSFWWWCNNGCGSISHYDHCTFGLEASRWGFAGDYRQSVARTAEPNAQFRDGEEWSSQNSEACTFEFSKAANELASGTYTCSRFATQQRHDNSILTVHRCQRIHHPESCCNQRSQSFRCVSFWASN